MKNKILNYKNRLNACLAIIFKPEEFNFRIESNKLQYAKAEKQKLSQDFEERVILMMNKQSRALLVSEFTETLPFLQVPIHNPIEDLYSINGRQLKGSVKQIEALCFYVSSPEINSADLKREASFALAEELYKKGFIKSRINAREIEFYINIV